MIYVIWVCAVIIAINLVSMIWDLAATHTRRKQCDQEVIDTLRRDLNDLDRTLNNRIDLTRENMFESNAILRRQIKTLRESLATSAHVNALTKKIGR